MIQPMIAAIQTNDETSAPLQGVERFAVGMSGREALTIIFNICKDLGVSDIQMRSGRPVYIHTNKGMEKLTQLGVLSSTHLDEILKELIRNREISNHGFGIESSLDERIGEKINLAISDFAKTRVADFSCEGIPMG
ncbi:MAG: Flp pilus assembly complex ATPase component TadA, partial [Verrucomicrobiota bacterium]